MMADSDRVVIEEPVPTLMANNQVPITPIAVNTTAASAVNPLANILADPMNPYFLHPGESPGLVLVSTPLT